MHREIGFVGAVHAQHAEEMRVRSGKGAQAHQRDGDGKAGQAHELDQQARRLGPGIDDAAAGIDHRALGTLQQGDRLVDPARVGLGARAVGAVRRSRRLR